MRANEFIVEYRDRLLQYVKSLLPTWPDYVLKDWLVPNKGNFSNLPADALKNSVMEKVKLAGLTPDTKWQLIPNMKFTMDMFNPMTTQRLIGRAGGHSDMGLDVPRDKERHATQAALAQQQGGVRKEPVLLIKTAKGYELLEGWHRTIQHFHKYPDGYTGPAYVAVAQGLTEGSGNNIPTIGINVRNDKDIDYASLIVDGKKKYESRKTDSLRPYVGKTVGIVRTGNGPAVAIGQVTIGEPILVNAEKFDILRKQHLVPKGSKFDIDSDGTKYLYPMINPVRWDNEKPIKNKGIVSRKIQEQLDEYNVRKTKKFIQRAHDQEQGQMYGNMPYSSHPKQVANLGKKFFGTKFGPEAVKVALLHDVLEDTPYTPDQLAKKGFSKEVIQAVQLLTKNKALSYADNIRNIINSGNSLAMMVKYSDNYMNYTGDKSHWAPERAAHSQKKYLASLNMLGDVLGIKKHIGDEVLDEYKVDNKNGLGSVPYNQDVDYFGMKVMMKPSTFLQLALPLNKPISVDHIAQHLKNGGSLGAPFLDVTIPKEWEEGDMSEPARVSGHEGRNRMLAIQQVEGDDPVEVHIFPKGGMRARDLTPEITTALRNGMMNQERSRFIRGDLFSTR
jgi:predicted transcriptional regulator